MDKLELKKIEKDCNCGFCDLVKSFIANREA